MTFDLPIYNHPGVVSWEDFLKRLFLKRICFINHLQPPLRLQRKLQVLGLTLAVATSVAERGRERGAARESFLRPHQPSPHPKPRLPIHLWPPSPLSSHSHTHTQHTSPCCNTFSLAALESCQHMMDWFGPRLVLERCPRHFWRSALNTCIVALA